MPKKKFFSSFTIIAALIALSIKAAMRGANAVVIDSEVTSRFEGLLSRVEGLKNLKSRTKTGSGYINMEMDEKSDMDREAYSVYVYIVCNKSVEVVV